MRLLYNIASAILFSGLALLSVFLGRFFFAPHRAQGEAMAWALTTVWLYPLATLGVIIGLLAYRLWTDRLFWILWLIVSPVAVLAGRRNGIRPSDLGDVIFVAFLLTPVFTVPLWQLVMAVAWVARGRRRWKGRGPG